jgi:hypothetical protein
LEGTLEALPWKQKRIFFSSQIEGHALLRSVTTALVLLVVMQLHRLHFFNSVVELTPLRDGQYLFLAFTGILDISSSRS